MPKDMFRAQSQLGGYGAFGVEDLLGPHKDDCGMDQTRGRALETHEGSLAGNSEGLSRLINCRISEHVAW